MPIDVDYTCLLAVQLHFMVKHTLSPAQHNKRKSTTNTSLTLSGLEAVEVQLWCLEVVHCWGLGDGAIGEPFAVLLLALWTPCCARGISVEVVACNLVDAMQVHAALLEQVLAPWLIAGVLVVSAHVVQRLFAIINVCHVCGCGVVADDCAAAEEAEIDVFAGLKGDAVVSHLDLAQVLAEPDGEEHGINVNLDVPIPFGPGTFLFDLLPGLDEHVGVDPFADALPLGEVEVAIDILDLDGVDLAGADPCVHIGVDPVLFTSEDACAKEELSPQQLQFVALLGAASVCCVECPAEEGVLCVCDIGLMGWDHCWCVLEASSILTWGA